MTHRPRKEPLVWPSSLAYPRVNTAPIYEVAADWPQRPAELTWAAVSGCWVDEQDRVWLHTRATPSVQVFSAEGSHLFSWAGSRPGGAHHMKMDREGHVWLADLAAHTVCQYNRDGTLLRTLGTPGESGCDDQHLHAPTDMAFASNGDIFVSDGYGNARIMHYDRHGRLVKSWGSIGSGPGELSLPHAIAIDSQDRIYVADRNNVRIQIYDTDGRLLDSWAHVIVPWGFWINADDELWVCGSTPMHWGHDPDYPGFPLGCPPKDQVVMRFRSDGRILQTWSAPKGQDGAEQPGDLNWLHCLALDSRGHLYCGDIEGRRLQKFQLKTA